jgi:hypothetical protein
MVVGRKYVNEIQLHHLPGQTFGGRTRPAVVSRQATYVHLQQGSKIAPRAHHVDRIVPVKVVVPFGMSDDHLASSRLDLTDNVVVVSQKLEAKLHQQVLPSSKTNIGTEDYPAYRGSIRRPNFLTQRNRWKISPSLAGNRQVIECTAVTFQLAVYSFVPNQVRQQQVRRGYQRAHIFLVQCAQSVERLRHTSGAVVNARDEVTM